MNTADPGCWILPSRGRALTNMPRLIGAAMKVGMTTPVRVVISKDDEQAGDYLGLDLPPNWTVILSETADTMSSAFETETKWALNAGAEWIGYLHDDVIPETPNWDRELIGDLNGHNVVSSNDGKLAPKRMTGAIVWSADLIRALGYVTVPNTNHFYFDDMWETLGRFTHCWSVRMDVMVRHDHAGWTPGGVDKTFDRIRENWANDERAWNRWRSRELGPACDRVLALMKSHGVDVFKPDLKDVSLMIGTPCGSGRFDRLYVAGLVNSMRHLEALGADAMWLEIPFVSDVALARNKVFGAFLRSDCTHLLFVDDDMGWKPDDIIRMLLTKVDFVAGAGPRKVIPMEFAVNVSDDYGQAVPITMDEETGLIPVTGVGMAFTMISKNCATRMAQCYADLAFDAADGRQEIGVFNPLIFNRRYMSEDFAFCHRWRQIKGKCLVMPDIKMDHVGSFTWSGSWYDYLLAQKASQRAAA